MNERKKMSNFERIKRPFFWEFYLYNNLAFCFNTETFMCGHLSINSNIFMPKTAYSNV